jgi:hypothetical protein
MVRHISLYQVKTQPHSDLHTHNARIHNRSLARKQYTLLYKCNLLEDLKENRKDCGEGDEGGRENYGTYENESIPYSKREENDYRLPLL